MHSSKENMKFLVEHKLNGQIKAEIEAHLEICEICRDFVMGYKAYFENQNMNQADPVADLTDELYKLLLRPEFGSIVKLQPLSSQIPSSVSLAADGHSESDAKIETKTFFSTNPEFVLRIVREEENDHSYLQLLTDEKNLNSFVMIETISGDHSYITNENGLAVINQSDSKQLINNEKWQVKFPDAIFELEPLTYDPDEIKFTDETILESDKNDIIKVVFQRKNKGKELKIQILQLDGSDEIGPVTLAVTVEGDENIIKKEISKPDKTARFSMDDRKKIIKIRLFHND